MKKNLLMFVLGVIATLSVLALTSWTSVDVPKSGKSIEISDTTDYEWYQLGIYYSSHNGQLEVKFYEKGKNPQPKYLNGWLNDNYEIIKHWKKDNTIIPRKLYIPAKKEE
jgi:hypothetical protein